ncbi:phage tail sheath family protein [Streptomyces pseudogriseolus]|uniref:phage tail sheath family protein n=1 Tax=Streptomyces pseudogriseolus TaxID=36817 RepID=UPI0011800D0B
MPQRGVRMDVCAFVGVAPRGPAWERADDPALDGSLLPAGRARSSAVPVESWAEYEEVFGGYGGPGLLPHAVAAFFAQGGRRAYVVRVVPCAPVPDAGPSARAVLTFSSQVRDGHGADLQLQARSEGRWGDLLTATLTFSVVPLPVPELDGQMLVLAPGAAVPTGTLLRLRPQGGADELRLVTGSTRRPTRDGTGWERLAILDAPVTGPLERAEEVTGILDVVDGDPARARRERFTGLGLTADHPRWLGALLSTSSRLVEPLSSLDAVLPADPRLAPADALATGGRDRYALITPEDFFGTDPTDPQAPPAGLDALRDLPDCASVVVPDLYAPAERPSAESVSVPATLAGAGFKPCVPIPGSGPTRQPRVDLPGLRLDPAQRDDRALIVALQQRVVAFAEQENMVALLDVPPGLRPRDVLSWRSAFDSSYAAAYHGWLRVPDPRADRLITVPSAPYAAGVIAAIERARGLPFGPAHVLLTGVVDVAEGPGRGTGAGAADGDALGALHRAGINVCVLGRDGVRITAARTLARDPAWSQLTARRTVSFLQRTLEQQLAWAVFEPNGDLLRDRLRLAVEHLLLDLHAVGAFAGGSPADSFFVRVPAAGTPAGPATGGADLLCEVGVAPSAPLEFLVVRVLRAEGDGMLSTEGNT